MSAASDLRKEIERAYSYKIMSVSPGSQFELKTECDVDAILDAVIAALPEPKQISYALDPELDESKENHEVRMQKIYRYGGYDFALSQVADLLQSAKTQKGEE